jgi:hypothetical protein
LIEADTLELGGLHKRLGLGSSRGDLKRLRTVRAGV